MNKKTLTAVLLAVSTVSMAQDIDFDFPGRNTSEVTEPNYIPWPVARVESESKTLDNGMTITLSGGGAASAVGSNWNKQSVQSGMKLVGDGVLAINIEDGNMVKLSEGSTSLILTIEGMTPGDHSLIAYHNNTDKNQVLPPIEVLVDGVVKQTGVKYSTNKDGLKMSDVGTSFVEFTVIEGQPVIITYRTVPEAGQSYSTTSVTLNGLEFDSNPYGIQDVVPANHDFHAAVDETRVDFSWTPAEVAASHRLVWGTDSATVAESTAYQYEGTSPSYSAYGFSPLVRYWWRVDEVEADGTVHKGKMFTFQPQRLAFPGAEGYGRFAIGGRGGVVYHVTSLLDDGSPGTLRYGIEQVSGPRTIVFDVGGVIALQDRLVISDKFVTLAGQTAPGRGILLRNKALGMQSDGITRFMRLHLGGGDQWDGSSPNPATSDGMGMAGNDHAIMDHCSIAWTIDEGFSSRNAKNMTLQHTMISEALNYCGHSHYAEEGSLVSHGYAATIGGGEMGSLCGSYHHNLLAHCEGRNWSLSGGLDGGGYYDGHHDVFNNVVYNWGSRATDGGTHELNFVNNFYKKGPASSQNYLLRHQFEGVGKGTQRAYVNGNIRQETNGSKTADREGVTYRYETSNSQVLDWEPWSNEPFFPSYATVETAEEAYQNVLSDVGCNLPEISNHDQRIINETLTGTTSTTGHYTGKKGLVDRESDAEGFEGLNIVEAQREDNWDTDQDGIPNWFETLAGTDPNTPNNNADRDGDFYTDLEEYLNWMACPNFIVPLKQNVQVDLKPYFAGYSSFSVELPPEMDNGTSWSVDKQNVLTFMGGIPQLFSLYVTAVDNNTGVRLKRQFNFAISETTSDPNAVRSIPMANEAQHPLYNLQGQQLQQPQKGINIQQGRKFVK
ncbi:MAG: hypothetical protein K5893_00740 [Prevotella sp.]|nr:hypothetical protein [Prevotella sp.]